MDRAVYYIWALLPLWFLALVLYSFVRRHFRAFGREPRADLWRMFIFSSVSLALAILVDKFGIRAFRQTEIFSADTFDILSWLTYPALLLVLAELQFVLSAKKDNRQK